MENRDIFTCYFIPLIVAILIICFDIPCFYKIITHNTRDYFLYTIVKVLIITTIVFLICLDIKRRQIDEIKNNIYALDKDLFNNQDLVESE